MRKRLLILLMAVFMLFGLAPGAALADITGSTDDGTVTWVFTDDGTLTFSGTGEVPHGDIWSADVDRDNVKRVVLNAGITGIGSEAFSHCGSLTSIEIPDSVTSIGANAFYACRSLKNINIPNSVTSIGNHAFSICSSLTSVTIPNSITDISSGAFSNCSSLTSITIPDSVTSIASHAFYSCYNLTSITIPDGVAGTGIGISTFEDCRSLTSIIIPDGVISIGESAFKNCRDLTSIYIPDSVTSIGSNAFEYCQSLTNLTIPDSVTSIGPDAFRNCSNLTSITIPDGITGIYSCVFLDCSSLINITIPDSVTSIGNYAFSGCSSLTGITITNSVTSIGEMAFNNCRSLTSIDIPNSVTDIKEGVFLSCASLTSVKIPDGVTSIGAYAFSFCEKLSDVYYGGTKSEWEKITIGETNECLTNATIHFNDNPDNPDNPDNVPVTNVTLNKTALNLAIGDNATLTATVAPDNATNKKVTFTSNNDKIATVDANGKVTALAAGNATITATTADGNKTATCTVTVTEKKIPVESVTLDKTALTLEVRTAEQLNAAVLPADATNKTVTWTTSNDTVAAVDKDGKVTAVGKGTAVITATAGDKKTECTVTVTADKVYTITFDTNGGKLANGVSNPDYVTRGEGYKMPTATRSSYTLQHWAIGAKDSQTIAKANETYTFTADTTVYAVWQYNGGGGGGHSGGNRKPAQEKPEQPTKPTTPEKPGTTTTKPSGTVTALNINNVFADVKNGEWYSEAVAYVYNKGMMNGTEKGFELNAATTRAMLVTMLYRLEGEPNTGNANFSDVADGQWFSKAIAWASSNGVVKGYENGDAQLVPNGVRGMFGPNDAITREQLAAVLYRYAQAKGLDVSAKGSLTNFSDSSKVSGWAAEAMQWAVGAGIINGDNGALKPQGNATRAEVAMMIMRFSENIK